SGTTRPPGGSSRSGPRTSTRWTSSCPSAVPRRPALAGRRGRTAYRRSVGRAAGHLGGQRLLLRLDELAGRGLPVAGDQELEGPADQVHPLVLRPGDLQVRRVVGERVEARPRGAPVAVVLGQVAVHV